MSKTEKKHAGETAKTGGARATAGKAKQAKQTRRIWRTVATKCGTVLISPTGERYHGTAAEVRAARLYPWERADLAQALKVWHYCWLQWRYCAESREELRRIAADRRRDIIQSHKAKARTGDTRGFDRKILAAACARYMGMTAEQFEGAWIDAGISAAIDEMPDGCEFLTRHEREAMSTPLYEWCDSLYAKRVLSERRAQGKERKA